MELTLYTKQTAPHRPVYLPTGSETQREQERKQWAEHAADPKKPKPGLCGACDWAYLRSDAKFKEARKRRERALFEFQRKGKLPPLPAGIKFGGARMSDQEARRVVLPRIPLSPRAGEDSYFIGSREVIEKQLERYLEAVNRGKKGKVFERQEGEYGTRVKVKRYPCGCSLTATKLRNASDWTEYVKELVCFKHRGAIHGRDESTGEIYGGE